MRFLYLIFIILPVALLAQPPQKGGSRETIKGWQQLTISDGLSQGMIFDLKQDAKGFIWAATKDGLNRYDGYNFKVFTHDPYNEYSLSDNACSALLIDRKGRLWVGTLNKGLNLYDDKTQRFYHISITDKSVGSDDSYEIRLLDEDPEGNIWVGTNVGKSIKIKLPASLQQGFPEQADFTPQIKKQLLSLNSKLTLQDLFHFSFNANGQCVTVLGNEIYTSNWRNPRSFQRFNLFPRGNPSVFDFYDDPQQDYRFVSTSQHLKAWHQGIAKSIALPGKTTVGAQIKRIDKNTLAISTASHLWLLSASQLFARDSLSVEEAFVEFPSDVYGVTSVLKDKTGTIWAGTSGYGLRKFNPRVKQFYSYLPGTTLSNVLVDRQGRTYARYQFAYGLLNQASNRLTPFLDKKLPEADQRQRHIMQDRQGFFWVSNTNFQTHAQQLFKFSSDWQLLKKYPMPKGIEFGFWGNQTLEDSTGYLWIGAMRGKLLRFDPRAETFQVYSYRGHLEMETYALLREPDGSFWIGTQQGLIKADHLLTKPTYSYYKNSTATRQSLSNDFVLSLANDPDEPDRYLWIGTKGGGLDRLDKQTGQFEHFTEAQGLPNKVVYGILADEFHHLWLSTNRGLSQFNPRTRQFRNYTRADGLQDDEFNTASFTKSPSGELLFGGVNGLNIIRPSELFGITTPKPVVNIIGLKVNNKPVVAGGIDKILEHSIEFTRQLNLAFDQNLLTFEFGVMDYTNSANNRYRYRLQGIDREWVEAGTNRFANYAQLPDGTYRMAMMGSVDGEHWSNPVELPIRVHPPFYRSGWAYLLYALVVVAVGGQLYRFQTQRLLLEQKVNFEQKEASRLAELDTLKTQFFTNISHEFRTPLTLIQGPLTDLKHRLKAESVVTLTAPVVELMERNSTRLLTLINQLLDLSKLEAGQLKSEQEPGHLPLFFRNIGASFESLAQSRQIRFSVEQPDIEWWGLLDRDKLEKIVTNLLSNAFKFTPVGHEVRLKVQYPAHPEGGLIQFSVTDTGIGIPPDQLAHIFERFYQGYVHTVDGKVNRTDGLRKYEGTGIGLAIVHELVRVLGGTITVNSAEGVGTSFRVTLPMVAISRPVEFIQSETLHPTHRVATKDGNKNTETAPLITAVESENRLLIIDDNADIRAYVRSIFGGDYHILEAADGQDGLELATAELPDVVICDLMMPRLDGFGFCRALKTGESTSHIPVVMLTAKATVADRIEGFELGADDYLTKPFNRNELRARVRNLVDGRQRLFERLSTTNPLPPTEPETTPTLLAAEQQFLDRLRAVVMTQLDNPDFTVEDLAEGVNMSRSQLHRKLKALTANTATNFIRDIRLTQAAGLLGEGSQSVTQVAYAVGFANLSYFAKAFQEQYGVLPSQYSKGRPVQT